MTRSRRAEHRTHIPATRVEKKAPAVVTQVQVETPREPAQELLSGPPRKFPGEVPASRPLTGFADPIATRSATDLVVFGATGDLMKRLLVPSLLKLTTDQGFPKGSTVLGVAPPRADAPMSDAQFRDTMKSAAEKFAKAHPDSPEVEKLTDQMGFQAAEFTPHDLDILKARLDEQDKARPGGQRLLYLALPPQVLPTAIKALKEAGMLDAVPGKPAPRLILEKPFGTDLKSAQALCELLSESLDDPKSKVPWQDRVLLIDHYMGKPAVTELIELRFGKATKADPWNGAFESMLNAEYISRVEVQSEENVDIGQANRGAFMEAVGAFRDMFQSHLQQVAALLVMDEPGEDSSFDGEQAKALTAFHTLTPDEVATHVVRGQYTAGRVGDRDVEAYREVEGVHPESNVETFFAVRTKVDDPKWDGVPFFIWSGKAMEEKESQVRIDFKRLSGDARDRLERFAPEIAGKVPADAPASLIIDIDPTPQMTLVVGDQRVVLKAPEDFDQRLPHQRLLEDAMEGKTDLFVSPDEALAQWENAEAVIEAWAAQPEPPTFYAAGTLPKAAAEFMDDDDGR